MVQIRSEGLPAVRGRGMTRKSWVWELVSGNKSNLVTERTRVGAQEKGGCTTLCRPHFGGSWDRGRGVSEQLGESSALEISSW